MFSGLDRMFGEPLSVVAAPRETLVYKSGWIYTCVYDIYTYVYLNMSFIRIFIYKHVDLSTYIYISIHIYRHICMPISI